MMKEITLNDAAKLLSENDNFIVLMHKSPDGDAIGCGYGLCMALRKIGKKANPLCGDEIPKIYNYITDNFQIQDFQPEYIVSVDLATENLLSGNALEYAGKIDLCIDHHESNTGFAKYGYVEGKTSSCAEIVKKLIDTMKIEFDRDMANAVFTGMCTDTGCFKYSSVTAATHRIAAELMECGAESSEICRKMFDSKSKQKLELERLVLDSLEFHCNDKVTFVCITKEMMEKSGASSNDTEGIAAVIRSIEGVEAGVMMREKENGEYRISLRTSDRIDASEICKLFGGGGHRAAAGCSITKPLEDAKKDILSLVIKAAENL